MGVRGVKLESVQYGRHLYTSLEAVGRFGRALAELDACRPVAATQSTSCPDRGRRKQRDARRIDGVREAEAFLAELGM